MSDPAASETLAAEIGSTYDAVPYDSGATEALSLARVCGAAAVLGVPPPAGGSLEVLDIGCGGGAQLLLAAQEGAARLVGIDASADACARARVRGAGLGERWRILHADAAGMDPADLGRFDVIYLLGTLYIMPPPARIRALVLLASSLKPGGVAVINYYTGVMGLVRTRLGRVLHGSNDSAWPLQQQLATARGNLQAIADVVPAQGSTREVVLAVVNSMQNGADTVLFHEALGPVYDPVHTGEVAAALAPQGLVFLNYITPISVQLAAGSAGAARTADAWDFASGGGYRTALFMRSLAEGPRSERTSLTGVRHEDVVWSTGLRPVVVPGAAASFEIPGRGGMQANTPAAHAILDSLIAAPRRWSALRAAALAWLKARGETSPDGFGTDLDTAIDDLLVLMWQNDMAWPAWQQAA